MPRWKPVETWKDRDVFIIGGGRSLKSFNWNLLKDECVIGCNDAFQLGEDICNICIFGDKKWFKEFKTELMQYKGIVFTSFKEFHYTQNDWIWTLERPAKGLSKTKLCWNRSTGANAINLALILGAKRVCLLGFDMKLTDSKPNWHDKILSKPRASVYTNFIHGMLQVKRRLPSVFPGREIVNVTDSSDLNVFPKISLKTFWKDR